MRSHDQDQSEQDRTRPHHDAGKRARRIVEPHRICLPIFTIPARIELDAELLRSSNPPRQREQDKCRSSMRS